MKFELLGWQELDEQTLTGWQICNQTDKQRKQSANRECVPKSFHLPSFLVCYFLVGWFVVYKSALFPLFYTTLRNDSPFFSQKTSIIQSRIKVVWWNTEKKSGFAYSIFIWNIFSRELTFEFDTKRELKRTEKSPESRNETSAISSTFDERAHIHSLTHILAQFSLAIVKSRGNVAAKLSALLYFHSDWSEIWTATKRKNMVETIKCKK